MKQPKLPYFQLLDELFRACMFYQTTQAAITRRAMDGNKTCLCVIYSYWKYQAAFPSVEDLFNWTPPKRPPRIFDNSRRKQTSFSF